MSANVIEGTWEEIKTHESELAGKYLRVTTISRRLRARTKASKQVKAQNKPTLQGYGFLKGLTDSEEFIRLKHEELDAESSDEQC